MLHAYRINGPRLQRLPDDADLRQAAWIDILVPTDAEVAALAALGIEVPTLEDMEEIEVSNRLYRENGIDYMTAVLPGQRPDGALITSPVTFILSPGQIVTVRHHSPRPFETYPTRTDKVGPGCADPERIFISLMEEIIGRLADLLESAGKALDAVAHGVYDEGHATSAPRLQISLKRVGREGELISRCRFALMTLERMISYFGQTLVDGHRGQGLQHLVKGLMRDIRALEVHGDFLSGRVALASDATLGMINLAQNQTIKIVSVVAAVFLPPTLIASIYGMNFHTMPELDWRWGYPMAIGLMVASVIATFIFFRWKKWL